MRNFFFKYDHLATRLLEILPGLVSWNLIIFPYWGVFFIPETTAYFILAFNVYWFYQSLTIAISSVVTHLRIQETIKTDWVNELKKLKNYKHVHHAIIVTTYKEPLHTLEKTLDNIANQTLPKNQISVCLAMEAAEPEEERIPKVKALQKKFRNKFANFFVTVHTLAKGEIKGKASNERYAAIWLKNELVDKRKMNIKNIIITSCDADHAYHQSHFALLTYQFLKNPNRLDTFWQGAVLFYKNIWELPMISRVLNTLMSMWQFSQLSRKDRLINGQNYSLPLYLLDKAGYWDPDKIPEDWGIFFKSFYANNGKVEVEPLYLPVLVDAAQSTTFWKTMVNQYEQLKRWAWGVSDTPWIVKNYLFSRNVPFASKTFRLITFAWSHFLWPVNWFLITIGLTLPSFINPAFGRTTLGYMVPQVSSLILTIALCFLVVMLIFDSIYRPPRPANYPKWKVFIKPLEFVLMPVVGFVFGALPGLDAHTRLMMGKYIDYRVTEKV
ncbi:MAG: glycosyltransferase family 2 protein [Patescibacteria group bacterium]|nr:glycosyltransferase family 2 protein [Patescibacteria group bacterium]